MKFKTIWGRFENVVKMVISEREGGGWAGGGRSSSGRVFYFKVTFKFIHTHNLYTQGQGNDEHICFSQ